MDRLHITCGSQGGTRAFGWQCGHASASGFHCLVFPVAAVPKWGPEARHLEDTLLFAKCHTLCRAGARNNIPALNMTLFVCDINMPPKIHCGA